MAITTRCQRVDEVSITSTRSMGTKEKGDLAELAISSDLAAQGYKVLLPFGDGFPYDVLITKDHVTFKRVQCKHCVKKDGALVIRQESTTIKAGRKVSFTSYDGKVDVMAAYEPESRKCYYIPYQPGMRTVSLRLDPPKSGQKSGIRFAKDHEKYTTG